MSHGQNTTGGGTDGARNERCPTTRLRAEIGAAAFDRYFGGRAAGAASIEVRGGCLRVSVPSRFAGSLIERRFGASLARVSGAAGLGEPRIEVTLGTREAGAADRATPEGALGDAAVSGPGRDTGRDSGRDTGGHASDASGGHPSQGLSSFAGGSPRVGPRPGGDAGAGTSGPGAMPTPRNAGRVGSREGGREGGRAESRTGDRQSNGRGPAGRRAGGGGGGRSQRRLDDFVVGASNRAAYEGACRMGDAGGAPGFGPLVIYGPCGVGKTHLLQGVASRFQETAAANGTRALVRSTTAEAFTSAYIEAVRSSTVAAFQRSFRRVSLLCIDDIHFLARKMGTQRELLHTFDALDLTGARIVLVSDEHPRDLEMLSEALVSRFIGGVVVEVGPPDAALSERLAEHLAAKQGLALGEGAARAVVTWVRTAAAARGGERSHASARDFSGAVARVRAMAGLHPQLLTGDGRVGSVMVDAALGGGGGGGVGGEGGSGAGGGSVGRVGGAGGRRGRVAVRDIIDASAEALGVSVSEVMGRGRHKRVVLARSVASYLSRELTNHSTPEIAGKLGRPNHSTVVTASKRIAGMIESEAAVAVGCDSDGMPVSELVAHVRRRVTAGL